MRCVLAGMVTCCTMLLLAASLLYIQHCSVKLALRNMLRCSSQSCHVDAGWG